MPILFAGLDMDTEKPYSPAAERNKLPILEVLKQWIDQEHELQLLEVGSGTGQHAGFLAPHFSNLTWQCSDLQSRHDGIRSWLAEAKAMNTPPPIEIDLSKPGLNEKYDIIYSANVVHIVSEQLVENLCQLAAENLNPNGLLLFYGPFKYNGNFTSSSNADFDASLRERDPKSGIRDIEKIKTWLDEMGIKLMEDITMPANNQFLKFQKL